ncbi:segregation and condensation protein A [Fervidobacterium thailandense]|uniref:Segregation and condensation protein A n=1 Tax=Fervidobacterium thailandense TaxID=1008305 RepID=A0A1E3G2T3_9BACT|nr:segregation/condensation protein A [Fervidobacterium thailandense]ODN29968.1 chromosome segregation protein ScpA [Fervidobacterium thailandense]
MELLFKLEQFEGPLDLLVYLVQKKQIDIRQLSISQLADEFVFYLRQMEQMNLNVTSEFIATAAYLLELKSKSLLPTMSERERKEYERSKELLFRRIEEYARLKELVEYVSSKENVDEYPVKVAYIFPKVDERKLVRIVKAALQEVDVKQKVYVIKREKYSIEKIMEEIEQNYEVVHLYELLRQSQSRYEVIVKFLAVLELIRFEKFTIDDKLRLMKKKTKVSGDVHA